ncbi:hypothetical protein LWI28_015274 [Acer negundo]|uniref:Uncharacterized protein n=1 Tax=Acer negundo TaxID=4023 RepID=A0AAD5JAR7_ACENE|nr:hypothetical protein LWI28_015274 [Acer negundo]
MASDKERLGKFTRKASFEGKRSFLDIVTRNHKCCVVITHMAEKVIEMLWNNSNNEDEWLSKCVVGTLKVFTNVSSVNLRLSNKPLNKPLPAQDAAQPHRPKCMEELAENVQGGTLNENSKHDVRKPTHKPHASENTSQHVEKREQDTKRSTESMDETFNDIEDEVRKLKKQMLNLQKVTRWKATMTENMLEEVKPPFTEYILQTPLLSSSRCHRWSHTTSMETLLSTLRLSGHGWNSISFWRQ